jgi:hypothetical protein
MTELGIPQEISVQTSENRITSFGLSYRFWENKYWNIAPLDNAWVILRTVIPRYWVRFRRQDFVTYDPSL